MSSSFQSGSSQGSSFQGIENPEALGALLAYIRQASQGGSADYKDQRARRTAALQSLQQSMLDYSNDAAFSDAAALMELNLQRSMEKAMPAISKGIQGAGSSAGSMQALMANKIAQEASLSAGALGAEQAKAYGQILANMSGTAEEFTRIDTSNEQGLLKALDLMRVGRSQQSSIHSGGSSGGDGGGGGSRSYGGGYVGGYGGSSFGGNSYAPSSFVGDKNWPTDGTSIDNEPFFYDDWGLGSDGNGGMSGAGFTSVGDYSWGDWGESNTAYTPSDYTPVDTSWDNYGSGDSSWSSDSGGYW